MKLLSLNTKIVKSNKASSKFLAYILQLAPHKTSGRNVCAEASKFCSEECLFYAGMGIYKNVQKARIDRTNLFFDDRDTFVSNLKSDCEFLIKKAKKDGLKPGIRLNGLSDLPWEKLVPELFNYPIQFWDYTKIRNRYKEFLAGNFPKNYHLTFSRSETNEKAALDFLANGGNVAVVGEKKPKTWNGFKVIDGDSSDFRFLDPKNRVVWLIPKGRAKKDTSGFVVRNSNDV